MRYRISVSIGCVAPFDDDARSSLSAEIGVQLAARHAGPVDELAVRGGVEVEATLRGSGPHDLTSPLEALSRVDASVLRALAVTGLFEEFDVARRTLEVRPA